MDDARILSELENPLVPGLARYQDLDEFISRVFLDGFVSQSELNTLNRIDEILDSEYMVAQDLISKMDSKSPMYAVAREMLHHLYRCRNLIDSAADKAKVYNELEKAEQELMERRERQKETLDIKVSTGGLNLINSLMTPEQRIQAERSFAMKAMKTLNPVERETIAERLTRVMGAMKETKLNAFQMNKMLCLGREM